MDQRNVPPPTPKDATQATEEQRELQEQLSEDGQDPDAPGAHNSRHDIADEA